MRTITIDTPPEVFNNDKEEKGEGLLNAIAYLSTWNMTGYDSVAIWRDSEGDYNAIYTHSTIDKPRYAIGAVWCEDEKRFSFHS